MVVEVRLFGNVAHAALVADQVVLDGLAFKEDVAEGHFDQAGDHLHGGGLAGAVGAEVAGDLAGAGSEADVVNRGNAGEVLGDAAQFEHRKAPFREQDGAYTGESSLDQVWQLVRVLFN